MLKDLDESPPSTSIVFRVKLRPVFFPLQMSQRTFILGNCQNHPNAKSNQRMWQCCHDWVSPPWPVVNLSPNVTSQWCWPDVSQLLHSHITPIITAHEQRLL